MTKGNKRGKDLGGRPSVFQIIERGETWGQIAFPLVVQYDNTGLRQIRLGQVQIRGKHHVI